MRRKDFALFFAPSGLVRVLGCEDVKLESLLFPIEADPDGLDDDWGYYRLIEGLNVPVLRRRNLGKLLVENSKNDCCEYQFYGVELQESSWNTLFGPMFHGERWLSPKEIENVFFDRPIGLAVPSLVQLREVNHRVRHDGNSFVLYAAA